ncbi:MAG: hypothetical protein KJ709_03540 [Nanoarchaeota archaeon]|nr:hypothetical protein [Nanoarchaeota archaeon]
MELVESFSGVRGKDLSHELVVKYAAAFNRELDKGKIILAGDTRPTTETLKDSFKLSLLSREIIDIGVCPTPVFSHAIIDQEAAGGIMITASHNPPEFNGWKLFGKDGAIFTPERMEKTIHNSKTTIFQRGSQPRLGHEDPFHPYLEQHQDLIDEVKDLAPKVLIDANGSAVIPLIKKSGLGFKTVNMQPGMFEHEIEPTEEALKALPKMMKEQDCILGAAFDCDADRVEFILPGRYIDGGKTLAVLAMTLEKGDTMIVNDATSHIVRQMAEGIKVIEAPVGETNIVQAMDRHNAKLGGEGSCGGVIFPPGRCRDGFLTLLHIMKILKERPDAFEKLPERAYLNEQLKCTDPDIMINKALKHFKDHEITRQQGSVKILMDDGFLWLRKSLTEPGILRMIADAKDEKEAKELISKGRNLLK